MALKVGDKAPEILGISQDGKEIKLGDYSGCKLILYFYPKDNTSGCTAEACSLRDNYAELRAKGYEVVGSRTQSLSNATNSPSTSWQIRKRLWQSSLALGAKSRCMAGSIWECYALHSLSTSRELSKKYLLLAR